MHSHRVTTILVAVALAAAACAGDPPPDALTDAATTTTTTTTDGPAGQASDESTPTIRDQLNWLINALAGDQSPSDAELSARFAPSFLAVVPPAALVESLVPLAGEYIIVEDEGNELELVGVLERAADGLRLSYALSVDPKDDGRINGLRFMPDGPDIEGDITPDVVDELVAATAAQGAYGVFEIENGRCEPIHTFDDKPLAIGSEFKLWILAAAAEQIDAGATTWDTPITVTPELRSTPDGEVRRRRDGEVLTVAELATLMISISDNTATDLLLDHLGRDNVEAAMVNAGVVEPERNIPMPSTRELFLLKLDPAHGGYLDLGTEQRRVYLDEALAGQPLIGPGGIDPEAVSGEPWKIDELEWYATPADMCRTMARLVELATDPVHAEHFHEALSTNPGATIDRERWPTMWFKGGSEPGVFAVTWYLVDESGHEWVLSGSLNDPDTDFGDVAGAQALHTMIPLLENRSAS